MTGAETYRGKGLIVDPIHGYLLYTRADGFRHYIGPERVRDIEPLRMYLDSSAQPVGGASDSPVTPFEPLVGIWSSVTRMTDRERKASSG